MMGTIPDWEIPRMNPEEAEAFSHSACSAFQDQEIAWRGDYEDLLAEDWPWYDGPEWNRWRLAAYVAWESADVEGRWPKTLGEFARLVGWSSGRPLRKYRARYPELDALIRESVLEPLFSHRQRVLNTLAELAETPDYKTHNDRKLYLEMTQMHRPTQDVNVRQTAITADEMASIRQEAAEEVNDWEQERFGEGDDDE